MQCGMPGLVAILPICHSCFLSLSLNHCLPPFVPVHPSMKLSSSLQHSKTYFLGVTLLERPGMLFWPLWGVNTSAVQSISSRVLLSSFCLSEMSSKPVYLLSAFPYPALAVYSHGHLFQEEKEFVFGLWPIPAPTSLSKHLRLHIIVPQALFHLLQMSSTMEHKQPNNWATAPCLNVTQHSDKEKHHVPTQ